MGKTCVILSSDLGITQTLEKGTVVGAVVPVSIVHSSKDQTGEDHTPVSVQQIPACRKEMLWETMTRDMEDTPAREQLHELLEEFQHVFSLSKEDRGETDAVELHIDETRRVPFAVREEIARSLKEMQEAGVIKPSNNPWASPVVLVKKDGTLCFCVDYRGLNAVTKLDKFPLPRIDVLLDQLGRARCFSTLDLAAGYWQIRVDKESKEKTAFMTQGGLFEFRVMPFGLTNAPAVFQRLMEKVLAGLKTKDGRDFTSVTLTTW